MDSVSQFALGASCAALALHGDSRPWRAVLVGGLVATLPDLDVLFSTGSPIADVRAHRGHSHSVLWRVVAVAGDHAYEGFWSVLDGDRPVRFERIDRGSEWLAALRGNSFAQSVDAFAQGFTKAERHGDALRCVDLRMGQEPHYVFAFEVARIREDGTAEPLSVDRKVGTRIDARRGLAWLWARMLGEDVASPR